MVVFVMNFTAVSPDVEGSVSLLRLLSLSFMLNLNTVIFFVFKSLCASSFCHADEPNRGF